MLKRPLLNSVTNIINIARLECKRQQTRYQLCFTLAVDEISQTCCHRLFNPFRIQVCMGNCFISRRSTVVNVNVRVVVPFPLVRYLYVFAMKNSPCPINRFIPI